ncbi:MAG: beta-galactosidase, partial [Porphyromonadaceae bacterium]|nr:beta-galactosidase [Porphyromonadaceae bacterium]
SMPDTDVKINGKKAGSKHQGGFYRFSYNITDLLRYGKKNLFEVTVKKESENASVNLAERRADYWNFGGIIRPVFLEIKPADHFERIAIDAQADGSFRALAFLGNAVSGNLSVKTEIIDSSGKKIIENTSHIRKGSDNTTTSLNIASPKLWTAETPNLYTAQFSLLSENGTILHRTTEKFGFRTIEVRESDGLYINNVRVNIRGVNRHSFRPETGRTLDRAKNYEDVRLMKEMNMNSVRLSHYPADPEFLEACDELGLYVMNELGGWHGKYDTPTGVKLVKSLVTRDVNHPSVIWWSNGNEKGWNTELDGEFHKWDIQKRPVLHPQGNFGGFETMHYRSYGESQEYMRKPEIWMPTEFLHGLYDGGHGAGLYDYWEVMRKHPRSIGGFLWVLADEGVKRVDQGGRIDNQGNFGADGIVGPHHEKEGSFFTIKEVWSPIQIMNKKIDRNFDGNFRIENRYDFTNMQEVTFNWEQVAFPTMENSKSKVSVINQGRIKGSDIAPQSEGTMKINMPKFADNVNGLFVSVTDKFGHELWRWSWRIDQPAPIEPNKQGQLPTIAENQDEIRVNSSGKSYVFSKKTGYLTEVSTNGKKISFANGPKFIGARRADRSLDQFYNHDDPTAKSMDRTYREFDELGVLDSISVYAEGNAVKVNVQYKLGNMTSSNWIISPDGTLSLDYAYYFDGVVDLMGIKFDYPEEKMVSKKWLGDGPYRVWQNRLHGTTYDVWETEYNDPIPGETFTYPEFKGYFANCTWMELKTEEGTISISNETPDSYIGVYQPRDGRDALLYTLPESGISLLNVIPAVRNKVNATDLIGPSSQPKWVNGEKKGRLVFRFN